jgi:hypothetical protein
MGKLQRKNLISQLREAGIDTSPYATELTLTRDGTLSLGAEDSSFINSQKLVLSLTSPLPLLYATSLTTIIVHPKLDPVNPLFLRVYRVQKPLPEEGEIVPKKPVPHTTAAINRTYMAS